MSEDRRFVRVRPQGMMSKTGKIIIDPKKPVIDCTVIESVGKRGLPPSVHACWAPKRFEFCMRRQKEGPIDLDARLYYRCYLLVPLSASQGRPRCDRPSHTHGSAG